jgi:hypothetical protein
MYYFLKSMMVMNNRMVHVGILSFSVLWCLIVLKNGLGVASDTTVYLEGAQSLIDTGTFTDSNGEFINHFPPFYSMLLAFFGTYCFRGNLWISGILLNGMALTTVMYVVFFSFYRICRKPIFSGLFFVLAIFSSFMSIFYWELTESIFLFLLVIQYVIWKRKLEFSKEDSPGNKVIWMFLGFLSGLLFLTRFAGFSVIFWWLWIILFTFRKTIIKGLKMGFFYGLGVLTVVGPWQWYVKQLGHTSINREWYIHFPNIQKMMILFVTLIKGISGNVFVGLAFLIVVIVLYMKLRKHDIQLFDVLWKNIRGFVWFSMYYIAFIVASYSFFDAHIQFDTRIFSPIFLPLLGILFWSVYTLWTHSNIHVVHPKALIGLKVSLVILCISQGYSGVSYMKNVYTKGLGYNEKAICESKAIQKLNISGKTEVWTNFPQLLKIHVNEDLKVLGTPLKGSTNNNTPNSFYQQEVTAMLDRLLKGERMAILLFKDTSRDFYFNSKDIVELEGSITSKLIIEEFEDSYLVSTPHFTSAPQR